MEILEFGITREDEVKVAGGCAIILDPKTGKYAVGKQADNGIFRLFSGGVSPEEDIEKGILREVEEESGLHDFLHIEKIAEAITHYYNTLKKSYRAGQATCLLLILKSTDTLPLRLEEHEKFTLDWATAEELLENWKTNNSNKDYDHWIYFLEKAKARLKELGY
jgi:8-oxo-dGTP pyrophosphatase MutT (NUDIX family)